MSGSRSGIIVPRVRCASSVRRSEVDARPDAGRDPAVEEAKNKRREAKLDVALNTRGGEQK
jgi:hypothetical protein